MEKIISIKNLTLKIKDHEILKDVNCDFESGKIHGLVGRNGSGKTMLMKCICGFVRPSFGEIIVNQKRWGRTAISLKIWGLLLKHPASFPIIQVIKT